MIFFWRQIRLVLAAAMVVVVAVPFAAAFETSAPTAFMKDFATGRVLFEKNADMEVEPASLAKLMTIAVVFDELEKGTISRDQTFTVSEDAWRTGGANSGGSTMFLPLGGEVSVDDLLKGIIIQSGNDATIVIAEGIAGSVDAFADMMNKRAQAIGLTHSRFGNSSGLPHPDSHVTMRDLVTLAEHLIREYPEEYPAFAEESYRYNGITQNNRNPLLSLGADGLKTGHTQAAGYGLVASAEADGRRVVFALSRMASSNERARESQRMMEFGLQDFEEVTLAEEGETVATVPVRGGVLDEVALRSPERVALLVPTGSLSDARRVIVDNGPVEAPVTEGQRLGWLQIKRGDVTIREIPLQAAGAVEQVGFFSRVVGSITEHLTWQSSESQ
ncbi:Serine-type D-Ala-D-Ala carboxypeptidase [Fulvimarina pelagi HTCC2506]|uniref:serine-type D-Ala-D-Ala carboxypeptidase n=1 Tax=Fulvimarina pelagi HTCC2506 TaxID=314231 RepID=Q0G0P7_9HYPH|nr:D-alanyl-D-alanine carboxypeptidase family protein [Fulvimarina pelagi]EAU40942.1 Serine-type D-Ala-D-Ala carboxypeptidase [Fulvimarina pelagi HTCC2506]